MFKYIIILFLSLVSFEALSNTIVLITNGTVTGTNGQQIKILSNHLENEGYKTEIKITNQNCALAKLLWDSSKDPTMMLISGGIDGLTDKDNAVCYMIPKREELIFWLHTSPYFFCSAGSKTWKDFIKQGTSSTVIIHPENRSVKLFEEISKKYNVSVTSIKVNSSSASLTMVKANEVDFVFRSGIFDLEVFKDKCEWASFSSHGLEGMSTKISNINVPNSFVANGYIISKNIKNNDIVRVLKIAADSSDMRKINERRNYNPSLVNFKNSEEYSKRLDELFNQLSE